MKTPGKLKVAIIGAGNWGLQHARVLSQRPDVELCAIVARTRASAESRAQQFGATAYTEISEMVRSEAPDLVCISLPNEAHFAPTLEVIRLGVPLFVEKPLVFDLHEADQLIDEAEQRGLFFAINFNHHYAKPVALAKKAISDGRLGEIVFASWRFGGEGGTSHPYNNLIETQCHAFDMLEFLCGPIDSVMAQMTDKTATGTFRSLSIAVHFENGAVGSLLGSYDSSYAYPDTHRLEINGTRGRVLVSDTVREYTFSSAGSEISEVWRAGYFNDLDRNFYVTFDRHMDAVLDAYRRGSQPPVHARAGRRALALGIASIESFRIGQRIDVDTASYEPPEPPKILLPPPNP